MVAIWDLRLFSDKYFCVLRFPCFISEISFLILLTYVQFTALQSYQEYVKECEQFTFHQCV